MRKLDDDLWVADSPLRFVGLDVGARMTVIRLPDGSLVLHSPIRPTDTLVKEVQALGRVAHLVAPNRFHHLFVQDWRALIPDAEIHAAPGLAKKRPDLTIDHELSNNVHPDWSETLDQVLFTGFPLANEIVFYHRPTQTLIATDLAFNVCESSPPLTRFAFKMMRAYGRLSPTLLERIFVRDHGQFRACLDQVLAWPFERVIVAHGDVSESGGRQQLIDGYSWLRG